MAAYVASLSNVFRDSQWCSNAIATGTVQVSAVAGVSSQFSSSGSNIYLGASSNLGIGVVPNYPLDVQGDINASGAIRIGGVNLSSPALYYLSMYGTPDLYPVSGATPCNPPFVTSSNDTFGTYAYLKFDANSNTNVGFAPSYSNNYQLRVPANGLYTFKFGVSMESNMSAAGYALFVSKNLGKSNDLDYNDDRLLALTLASPTSTSELDLNGIAYLTSNDLLSIGLYTGSNNAIQLAPKTMFQIGFANGSSTNGAALSSNLAGDYFVPNSRKLGLGGQTNPAYALDVFGQVYASGGYANLAQDYLSASTVVPASVYALSNSISQQTPLAAFASLSNTTTVTIQGQVTTLSNSAWATSNQAYLGLPTLLNATSNQSYKTLPPRVDWNSNGAAYASNAASFASNAVAAETVTTYAGQSNVYALASRFNSNVAIQGTLTVNNLTYLYSNITVYAVEEVRSNLVVQGTASLSNPTGAATLYSAGTGLGVGAAPSAGYALDVSGQVRATGGYAALEQGTVNPSATVPASAGALSNAYGLVSARASWNSNTAVAASNTARWGSNAVGILAIDGYPGTSGYTINNLRAVFLSNADVTGNASACNFAASAYPAPPTGAIAYYAFNASAPLADSAAGTYPLTPFGAFSNPPGMFGGTAVAVTNSNAVATPSSGLTVPSALIATGLGNAPPVSVSCWFNTTVTPANKGPIFAVGGTTADNAGACIRFGGSAALQVVSYTAARGYWASNVGVTVTPGTWYHVGLTMSTNVITVYVNGAQVFQSGAGANFTNLNQSGTQFAIGGCAGDSAGGFTGRIDEVRVYNRVLDAGEVALLAARPSIGAVNASSVVATNLQVGQVVGDLAVAGNLSLGAPVSGAVGNICAGNLGMFRNRIINGDCRIDQRNNGGAVGNVANATYIIDRTQLTKVSPCTVNCSQVAITALQGFNYAFGTQIATATATVGSTDVLTVYSQAIEANNVSDLQLGTAFAKPFTVSFWLYSSIAHTFYLRVAGGTTTTRVYLAPVAATAGAWKYFSFTIPGDTLPTAGWTTTGSAAGLGVVICTAVGSVRVTGAQANTWNSGDLWGLSSDNGFVSTASAYAHVTGVQVEKGTLATPFEFRPYPVELQLCQRYFWQWGGSVFNPNNVSQFLGFGFPDSTNRGEAVLQFPVTMRAPPGSITGSAASNFQVIAGLGGTTGSYQGSSVNFDALTTQNARVYIPVSGTIAAYQPTRIVGFNNAALIQVSAEL